MQIQEVHSRQADTMQMGLSSTSVATPDVAESEIISRAAAGDGVAFEILMRRYNQLAFRTARSILRSDSDAEDAVQEAYLRAWRALGQYRGRSRFSTWLVRIVTNEALGRLRKAKQPSISLEAAMKSSERDVQAAFSDKADYEPEQALIRAQLRQILEDRIDSLPEAFRTVFMLRAVEEMSVDEVSAALEIPPATVRSRFFRARGLLRESLGAEMGSTMGEVFAFDGARCDRIVAGVLSRAAAEQLFTDSRNPGDQ